MKATIQILGKKYSAESETVGSALASLPYTGFAKFKSVLTVFDSKKEKTVVLYPMQTLRLFSKSPLMKEIAVKQIATRFT